MWMAVAVDRGFDCGRGPPNATPPARKLGRREELDQGPAVLTVEAEYDGARWCEAAIREASGE